jgi:hypothetical protein
MAAVMFLSHVVNDAFMRACHELRCLYLDEGNSSSIAISVLSVKHPRERNPEESERASTHE